MNASLDLNIGKRIISIATALITLSACGGGSNGEGASVSNDSGTKTSDKSDQGISAPPLPSANASFFDNIFMNSGGAGYYQFDANWPTGGSRPTATGRTRIYVNSDADTNFSVLTTSILGSIAPDSTQVYVTGEGVFTSVNPYGSNIGSNSTIFQRLSQGYQLGMKGLSTPLYEITLTINDVAGQPARDVVARDEGVGGGLVSLLYQDASPMPAGAKTYTQVAKTLAYHLSFNLLSPKPAVTSLEAAQANAGGTIQMLGGLRYLRRANSNWAYVEYNSAIRSAYVYAPGDIDDAMPSGYNQIAADFLAQEEQKVGL